MTALRWRCHVCGETFTAYAPAQRHADAQCHHRIELLFPEEDR